MSFIKCSEIKYTQRFGYTHGTNKRHWKLGVGPCGKTVKRLEVQLPSKLNPGFMLIKQYCKGQKEPDIFWVPSGSIEGTICCLPLVQGPRVDSINPH